MTVATLRRITCARSQFHSVRIGCRATLVPLPLSRQVSASSSTSTIGKSDQQHEHSSKSSTTQSAERLASTSRRIPYWQKIPRWRDIQEQDFLTYSWQVCLPANHKFRANTWLTFGRPETASKAKISFSDCYKKFFLSTYHRQVKPSATSTLSRPAMTSSKTLNKA